MTIQQIVYTVAAILAFLAVRWVWRHVVRPINRTINEAGKIVKRGIPSPEQIRVEFKRTMHREPTIEEVADLHAMARTQHNQALLSLGAMAGGGLLVAHAIHDGGW